MSLIKLLKKHGVSAPEITLLKRRAEEQVKVDPFATKRERERAVIEEYLTELQSERENILTQVQGGEL